jgi:uncharacterized protein (DUF2147 family)
MRKIVILVCLFISILSISNAQQYSNSIIGKWITTDANLIVEVYQLKNEYRAKIIWFDDSDDKGNPMKTRCDTKNPNKSLRNRKIIGLEVLHGLVYNSKQAEWLDGRIYDPSSGKNWNAKAWLSRDGLLKVRGFWHFEIFGRNISFIKV